MWKKYTFLIAISTTVQICLSQNVLTADINMMRDGDVLTGQLLKFISAGDNGKNAVWDFSNIELQDKEHRILYHYSKDSLFYEIGPKSMNKYKLHKDSLFLVNYQNPITTLDYEIPVLAVKYPLLYGDTYTSSYKGHGMYSGKNALEAKGIISVEADGCGSIMLPKGRTINDVLRVHTVMTSSVGLEEDSVVRDATDRVLEIIEYYRWYAKGYRYPLFEMQTTSYFHNADFIKSEQTAYKYASDAVPPADNSAESDDSVSTGIPTAKDSIIRYNIQNENNIIIINYSLSQKARILALVAGVMGEVYRQGRQTNDAGDNYCLTLDCNGLRRGEYILYLNVNGRAYSHKVSIR